MDLDLFKLYVARGKGGDHLDKLKNYDFDSTRVADARSVMTQAMRRIAGSDKAEWNIYSDQDRGGGDYEEVQENEYRPFTISTKSVQTTSNGQQRNTAVCQWRRETVTGCPRLKRISPKDLA
ncbi:hypothetical protein PEC18_09105 [Paucibacter sp. O1-1]|nr:hypothetical protein [Paucibacter sp. O1-1]MDA3826013.1 hypothetical protein [Paucibacter sp. O1-1]